MASSASKGEWLKRSVALLLSTFLSVGLGELIFRAYEATYLAGELKIGKHSVDLAGMNFNDTRVRRQRDTDEFRILSLGDSFAYGTLKYPYSYHAIAADRLNEKGVGKRVRMVNLGEPSVSFYQYMDRYRFWSEIIEHDGVLFNVYLGNDIIDVALGHVADKEGLNRLFLGMEANTQTGLPRMRVPNKYGLRMVDYATAFFKLWRGDIQPVESSAGEKYMIVAAGLSEEAYYGSALSQLDNFDVRRLNGLSRGYEALLQFLRTVSAIRREGKRVAVFLSPSETQASPQLRAELVRRYGIDFDQIDLGLSAYLIREAWQRIDPEIPLLDLRWAFARGEEKGQDLYLGTNTHWAAEGDELAGRCLADFLMRRWFGGTGSAPDPACTGGEDEGVGESTQKVREQALHEFLLPLLRGEEKGDWPARVTSLAGLERRPGQPAFALTTINGANYDALGTDRTVPRDPQGLSMNGWAAEKAAADLAGGVVVEVNGQDFAAEYGLSRSDVALHFSNWKLHAVGFSLRLPRGAYPEAPDLTLRFKVLSKDGDGYYEVGPIQLHLE